jgi:16S rRNA U516 pseudouridylate synthase RsuA-like enzyme
VLDAAAVALHNTAYVLDQVRSDLTQEGPAAFDTERGTKTYADLTEKGKELDALTARLAVRLGREHEIVREFAAADGAVLKLYRAVGQLRLLTRADHGPGAERQVEALAEKHEAQIGTNRERFDTAREGFMAAAHKVAGTRLR